jgi:hypothetical protein
MPDSNTAEQLDGNFQFAGADPIEAPDFSGLDRGDDPEAVIEDVVEETPETTEEVIEDVQQEAQEESNDSEDTQAEEEADVSEVEEEVTAEETEEVAEAPKKADEKQHMVPKSRMDEEIARRRQLEERISQLEESTKPKEPEKPPFDFDAAEASYMEAVLDGDTDKAKVLRQEIRAAERATLTEELRGEISNTTNVTKQQLELDTAVATMVGEYPVLDSKSEFADQELINEANELMGMYAAKGMAPADALRKAVRLTIAANAPEYLQTAPAAEPAPAPVAKKRETNVKQKLEAAQKQPPKLAGESAASRTEETLDIKSMTDQDFLKLSEAQLKRLRGDFG